mmetsp:Transcript_11514/g.36597  ORF Transcript_11514/g.36597 Transcript_11514/m.36597 type:complete len:112 (+) Transcript_11514:289-624(+)
MRLPGSKNTSAIRAETRNARCDSWLFPWTISAARVQCTSRNRTDLIPRFKRGYVVLPRLALRLQMAFAGQAPCTTSTMRSPSESEVTTLAFAQNAGWPPSGRARAAGLERL